MKSPLYLHACELITSIGIDRQTCAIAQTAGISSFQASTYLNAQQTPIAMGLVPESALPLADPFLELLAELTAWEYHLLRLAHLPLAAVWPPNVSTSIPVMVVVPEVHPRGSAGAPEELIRLLAQQTQLPICQIHSQVLPLGRAGLGVALDEALRLLQEGLPCVIVGGVDSYQQERLLTNLDADGRLASPDGPSDGFIPSEGAAWLLLSLQPNESGIGLASWSIEEELGHLYSNEPYKGEALARAARDLFVHQSPQTINRLYSTANGEHYWAKELAVMMTRSLNNLPQPLQHIHPADCWGDLGAASGAALIALAFSHFEKNPNTVPALISCASDQGLRTLALLKTIEG